MLNRSKRRFGLAPGLCHQGRPLKRESARYRFNFGLLRIWMKRITQRTYALEPWTEPPGK
jgi:hypothetical protein